MATGFAPNIKIDDRQFKAALKEYLAHTSRDLADALNTKALYIARGAVAETPRAKRAAIEKLGLHKVSVKQSASKSRGIRITRKFKLIEEDAIRNYLASRKRAGKPANGRNFANRSELALKARKWIGAKLRAIGFLASGWIPSIRTLTPLVGGAYQRPADTVRSPGKLGRCIPAKPGWNPFVLIENSSTLGIKGKDPALAMRGHQIAVSALQRAINTETNSMRQYIADKLQKTANKFKPKP